MWTYLLMKLVLSQRKARPSCPTSLRGRVFFGKRAWRRSLGNGAWGTGEQIAPLQTQFVWNHQRKVLWGVWAFVWPFRKERGRKRTWRCESKKNQTGQESLQWVPAQALFISHPTPDLINSRRTGPLVFITTSSILTLLCLSPLAIGSVMENGAKSKMNACRASCVVMGVVFHSPLPGPLTHPGATNEWLGVVPSEGEMPAKACPHFKSGLWHE